MKGKRVIGITAIAMLSAFFALFIYTRYFDEPVVITDSGNVMQQPVKFTANTKVPAQFIDFTEITERVVHAVVHVKTKTVQQYSNRNPVMEYFYGDSYNNSREVRSFGSGVLISTDGYIITNNHVIEDANEIEVTLNDKRTFEAEVVGRDPSTDIALLKIEGAGLPYLGYGNSDQLKQGEWVLAIGNPFNLTSTVTAGIVSAKGRSLNLINDRYRIESFIQTDAALNVGNSGGALVNIRGELVGITTAILSSNWTYAGNSFAVPVSIVEKVAGDLKEYGEVQRAIIGVNITDVDSDDADQAHMADVKGVMIEGVTEGGAAEDAGLKAGDIIVRIDKKDTDNSADLQEYIGKKRPGDRVKVTVFRNSKEREFDIVLRNLAGGTNIVKSEDGGGIIFGVSLEPLLQQDLGRYRIDGGLRVTSVNDGAFDDLGIEVGDIITEINGEVVNTISEVRDFTNNGNDLRAVNGIQLNGTSFSYQFRQ